MKVAVDANVLVRAVVRDAPRGSRALGAPVVNGERETGEKLLVSVPEPASLALLMAGTRRC